MVKISCITLLHRFTARSSEENKNAESVYENCNKMTLSQIAFTEIIIFVIISLSAIMCEEEGEEKTSGACGSAASIANSITTHLNFAPKLRHFHRPMRVNHLAIVSDFAKSRDD
jgi:peroxiredoxin